MFHLNWKKYLKLVLIWIFEVLGLVNITGLKCDICYYTLSSVVEVVFLKIRWNFVLKIIKSDVASGNSLFLKSKMKPSEI